MIITIVDSGEQFSCAPEETILKALSRLGRRGIPQGCFGGGCGVCRVRILSGKYQLGKQSRAHISTLEEQLGDALACKVYPEADLSITVTGLMRRKLVPADTTTLTSLFRSEPG